LVAPNGPSAAAYEAEAEGAVVDELDPQALASNAAAIKAAGARRTRQPQPERLLPISVSLQGSSLRAMVAIAAAAHAA